MGRACCFPHITFLSRPSTFSLTSLLTHTRTDMTPPPLRSQKHHTHHHHLYVCGQHTSVPESPVVLSVMFALAVFLLSASALGSSIPLCPDEVGTGRCDKSADTGACYSTARERGMVQCLTPQEDFNAYRCPSTMPSKCRYHEAPTTTTTTEAATTTATSTEGIPEPAHKNYHLWLVVIGVSALLIGLIFLGVWCRSPARARGRVVPEHAGGDALYNLLG